MQRRIHPLLLTVSAGLLLGGAQAGAQLQWDAMAIDLRPQTLTEFAETNFAFVNAGETAVTIESVKSLCGCAVAALQKRTYAKGERGEVAAKFIVGDRRGFQSANILVAVKGQAEPVTLTLNVTIPEAAKLTPGALFWDAGAAAKPKTIDVEALPGQPIQVAKATASAPGFEVKVETVEKNAKYRIVVTPASTDKPAYAMLEIETQIATGPKIVRAHAQVCEASRSATPPESARR